MSQLVGRLLVLLSAFLQVCCGKGGSRNRVAGGGPGDELVVPANFDYWNQGTIPLYIWVIAGLVTVLSVGVAVCTECLPDNRALSRLKKFFGRRSLCRQGQDKAGQPRQLRMLSISSDEFVLPVKN